MSNALSNRFQKGVAAIEFALLVIPLVLFTLTAVEAGRALYYYNTLLKSTRDASRYLSMQSPGMGHAQAQCLAVYGNTNCSNQPVLPGLATGMVGINERASVPMCTAPGACFGTMNLVEVRITGYQFKTMMVPLLPETVTQFTFGRVATTMRQAVS